jgi:hypothetical protein
VLVLELLKYAAHGRSSASAHAVATAIAGATDAELQWALDGGLGPLAYEAVAAIPAQVPQDVLAVLQGADLTAKVIHANRVEAAAEVIELCASLGVTVMPLKGISISEQHYRAPHHRPMTDIDFLALGRPYDEIEAAFLQRGYELSSIDMGADPAHGRPLRDPHRNVWVEIHTSIFPLASPLQRHPVFAQPMDRAVAVDSDFSGRAVLRLRDEAQLLYVAAYWSRDLSMQSIDPTFIMPLLDAIVLLGASGTTIKLEQLDCWLGDDQATASLYLLLSCLSRHELVSLPAGLLTTLAERQTIVGRAENWIIQSLIDRYLLGGRSLQLIHSWHAWANLLGPGARYAKSVLLPWRIAFPPSYPQRFDLSAQAQRITRLVRRTVRRVEPRT